MDEVKITVPEGYVIDTENSTFECVKFKKKSPSYDDVCKSLFYGKTFYRNTYNSITNIIDLGEKITLTNFNNCTSRKQAQKILAINALINVAKYLNGDWKPNFKEGTDNFTFELEMGEELKIASYCILDTGLPCFKTKELAQQAIDILGEETVKLALSQV